MHPLVECCPLQLLQYLPAKVGPYLKLEEVVRQAVEAFGMVEAFEMVESAAVLKFAEYVSTWLRETVCPQVEHTFGGNLHLLACATASCTFEFVRQSRKLCWAAIQVEQDVSLSLYAKEGGMPS